MPSNAKQCQAMPSNAKQCWLFHRSLRFGAAQYAKQRLVAHLFAAKLGHIAGHHIVRAFKRLRLLLQRSLRGGSRVMGYLTR